MALAAARSPDLAASDPPYQRIAAELRAEIRAGRLLPGQSLPSTRALASKMGFTKNTVAAAYRVLVDEGCVAARFNGYVVRASADAEAGRQLTIDTLLSGFESQLIARGFEPAEIVASYQRAIAQQMP
jgi:DNA-binding transcriptional regulator YhcF (GntR family)